MTSVRQREQQEGAKASHRGALSLPRLSPRGDAPYRETTMPTAEQIEYWFTYHPPTAVMKAKFKAISGAEQAAYALAYDIIHTERFKQGDPAGFAEIARVLRELAVAINENAPECADKSAAIRNVRLARNALNDVLAGFSSSVVNGAAYEDARRNITEARRNANAAIALEGR